jgi:hypothetical protein
MEGQAGQAGASVVSGYLFVRLARRTPEVQRVPGVARLVGFGGTPTECRGRDRDPANHRSRRGTGGAASIFGGRAAREGHAWADGGLQGILTRRRAMCGWWFPWNYPEAVAVG